MFKIPEKQIIVNSDDQVRLLHDDEVTTVPEAYADGDLGALATDNITIEGFLGRISGSALVPFEAYFRGIQRTVLVHEEDASLAVAHQITYTVTATAADEGDVFRLVFKSVDGAPTDFQNDPVSKIYQIPNSGDLDSAIDIATAMEAAINADPDAMVTVSRADAVLTLTAKDTGVEFNVRIDSELSKIAGTEAVVNAAARSIHDYEYLKNIEWSNNLDFDRNQQWQPLKGVDYKMYKFKVKSTGLVPEGYGVPNVAAPEATTVFKLWVASGATVFRAAMDDLVDDANLLT